MHSAGQVGALGAPARLSVPRGLLMPQKKSGKHDCGLTVFQHACRLGCEGIVSKRLGSLGGSLPDVKVEIVASDYTTAALRPY